MGEIFMRHDPYICECSKHTLHKEAQGVCVRADARIPLYIYIHTVEQQYIHSSLVVGLSILKYPCLNNTQDDS